MLVPTETGNKQRGNPKDYPLVHFRQHIQRVLDHCLAPRAHWTIGSSTGTTSFLPVQDK